MKKPGRLQYDLEFTLDITAGNEIPSWNSARIWLQRGTDVPVPKNSGFESAFSASDPPHTYTLGRTFNVEEDDFIFASLRYTSATTTWGSVRVEDLLENVKFNPITRVEYTA